MTILNPSRFIIHNKQQTYPTDLCLIQINQKLFLIFVFFFILQTLGGVAPPGPAAAMIMEGLETLVAPPHAFLLTESAAAAHFNVLSFDSLLKTAATTSSITTNNNNIFTANNNNHLNHYHLHHHQHQSHQQQQHHHQQQHHQQQHLHHHQQTQSVEQTNTTSTNTSNNCHPHLSLLTSVGDTVITDTQSSVEESQTVSEAQTGDLNTPVTTSSDIPSFFGPSTVVEPPPISGKFAFLF